MPITQRNGDTVTVTILPDEEQKLKQFEQEAIKNNIIVNQHGASMIEKEEQPLRHNDGATSRIPVQPHLSEARHILLCMEMDADAVSSPVCRSCPEWELLDYF